MSLPRSLNFTAVNLDSWNGSAWPTSIMKLRNLKLASIFVIVVILACFLYTGFSFCAVGEGSRLHISRFGMPGKDGVAQLQTTTLREAVSQSNSFSIILFARFGCSKGGTQHESGMEKSLNFSHVRPSSAQKGHSLTNIFRCAGTF